MKKSFKVYSSIWLICLALLNVICFVTPGQAAGMSKFGGAFWTGYVFITLAFIGQLICAHLTFKADNLQKLFYGIPLISVSYTGLVIMLFVGALTMAIPNLPNWVGITVCLIVLAFTAIAVITAKAAGSVVSGIDERIGTNTEFIKELTIEAQNLVNRANAPILKKQCRKVHEVLQYSDPVSNDELSDIEHQIREEFDMLSDAIMADDLNLTESSVKELLSLVKERNNKCKLMK